MMLSNFIVPVSYLYVFLGKLNFSVHFFIVILFFYIELYEQLAYFRY